MLIYAAYGTMVTSPYIFTLAVVLGLVAGLGPALELLLVGHAVTFLLWCFFFRNEE